MYKRVLVPVDGSPASGKGLAQAIRFAKETGAKLKLVHVVNEVLVDVGYVPSLYAQQIILSLREAGQRVLQAALDEARTQGVAVDSELIETAGVRAADAIVDQAKRWQADLIVMGTHGRRGLHRVAMGSDAEMVLRQTPVPMLMIRHEPEAAEGTNA
jgi:nucleotide-binding universal stress UspA family protein